MNGLGRTPVQGSSAGEYGDQRIRRRSTVAGRLGPGLFPVHEMATVTQQTQSQSKGNPGPLLTFCVTSSPEADAPTLVFSVVWLLYCRILGLRSAITRRRVCFRVRHELDELGTLRRTDQGEGPREP